MQATLPNQKLIFVLGKGGVGRTTVSASLAEAFAQQNEKVLLVQWTVHDAISPLFGVQSVLNHSAREIFPGVSVMTFSPDEAMREYFVDHLRLKLLYNVVVENKHVKKFVNAAPGVHELFFLGRLYWLVALAKQERGWGYDRVIVDAPAMGHGVSLFRIAPTIASLGMTGPLAAECERVSTLLFDEDLVGTIVVTIPEELPIEETVEFLPTIEAELKRPPLCVILNRAFVQNLLDAEVEDLAAVLTTDAARSAARLLASDLRKREAFTVELQGAVDALNLSQVRKNSCGFLRVLDAHLLESSLSPQRIRESVTHDLLAGFRMINRVR